MTGYFISIKLNESATGFWVRTSGLVHNEQHYHAHYANALKDAKRLGRDLGFHVHDFVRPALDGAPSVY